jgi:predicted aconitase with swiveling domain
MIEATTDGIWIQGRRAVKGKAQGEVLKSPKPISLLNQIELDSGIIKKGPRALIGKSVTGKVFALPYIKDPESCYDALLSLKRSDLNPIGIILRSLNDIHLNPMSELEIPIVYGIDVSLLSDEDEGVVNGSNGSILLKGIKLQKVSTAILLHEDKILLLKRSEKVGSYKGMWAGISGYVEEDEVPEETAMREIQEEIGLEKKDLKFLRKGEKAYVRYNELIWLVHPILFETDNSKIHLDWEHVEFKWIRPGEILNYDTVPKFKESIRGFFS